MRWGPISGISEEEISRPARNDLGSCLILYSAVSSAGTIASLIFKCRKANRQQNFSEEVMTARETVFIMETTKKPELQHIFLFP